MSDLARRQAVLARFLADPIFEAQARADAAHLARAHGVDVDYVERLAAIEPARVAAFRASRVHKDALRAGKKSPQRAGDRR